MNYLLFLLAVTAVFANPLIDRSFEEADRSLEDKPQDIQTPNIDNDDRNHPAPSINLDSINVQALTALINSVIDKKFAAPAFTAQINRVIDEKIASQPGKSKTYKLKIFMSFLLIHSCTDALYFYYTF